jgi:hypothetical protein
MSTAVAAMSNDQADRVRALRRQLPYFTVQDIAATTGIPIQDVRAALGDDYVHGASVQQGTIPVYRVKFRD